MAFPKIYLAIDNCFAKKRWTEPAQWCAIISDLGIKYVEASADTELDPLYMGPEYLADWVWQVEAATQKHGLVLANLYSGHGTYSTLGLTHTDPRVRRRIIDKWFKPMIRLASRLKAGLGFFAHAFPQRVLNDASSYQAYVEILETGLIELNQYAAEEGCKALSLEQMYSPHQYPWTIEQTENLLAKVSSASNYPFYFTEDLGHHHMKFCRPSRAELMNYQWGKGESIWLGSEKAYSIAKNAQAGWLKELEAEMDAQAHLFATRDDGDCYAWLKRLGRYANIIHLQQTDGSHSKHLAFTKVNNEMGIISPAKLLQALYLSFKNPPDSKLPAASEEIYLTLEIFAATTDIAYDILKDQRESIAYFRQFVPEDGLPLDELVRRLSRPLLTK